MIKKTKLHYSKFINLGFLFTHCLFDLMIYGLLDTNFLNSYCGLVLL